jgi:hypothetical protein
MTAKVAIMKTCPTSSPCLFLQSRRSLKCKIQFYTPLFICKITWEITQLHLFSITRDWTSIGFSYCFFSNIFFLSYLFFYCSVLSNN